MTVVLADSLHRALADLDGVARKRVVDFLIKLQTQPRAPGVRLKPINNPRDARVRTARVTDDLRAVLLHLGDSIYLIQTVLPHDDAYHYAEQLTVNVNPVTGAVEAIEAARIEAQIKAVVSAERTLPTDPPPLLAHVTERDFAQLGIPDALVSALQRISNEDELLALVEPLPSLQQDIILTLLDQTPDQVFAEIVTPAAGTRQAETDDLPAALQRPVNQAHYLVATSADELTDALAWPMDRWRIYLHPSQRILAYPLKEYSGPVKVTGGPGTGKTIVAVHRAKALADTARPGERILLTTFGSTLTKNLEDLLSRLGGGRIGSQVDVLTTDKLARKLLDYAHWQRAVITDDVALTLLRSQAGQAGVHIDPVILHDEWNRVVLDQQRTTREGYLSAPRRGMRRLSPITRQKLWPVLESFTQHLADNGMATFRQMTEKAAQIADRLTVKPYRHVVVDEAQDMTAAQWRLLRSVVAVASDDMFIVGDAHQRIYDSNAVLSHYGIRTKGRSKRLTISYRTTREIVRVSLAIVKGHHYDNLDDEFDTLDGYRSLMRGSQPQEAGYTTSAAEIAGVTDRINSWLSAGVALPDIAIGARTKQFAASIADALNTRGTPARLISPGAKPPDDAVHVMTLHRLKGLEYRCVALAGMSEGILPPSSRLVSAADDPIALRSIQDQERALVFVACTRAREALSVTWHGAPSELIAPLIAQSQLDNSHASKGLP